MTPPSPRAQIEARPTKRLPEAEYLDRYIWPRVEPQSSGCWIWTGYKNFGYGRVSGNRRIHRVVYEFMIGPIPAGLFCDHLCRNRACCNPLHIELVTNRENVLRGSGPTAENAKRTHCRKGHVLAGDNLQVYTTPEAVRRICLTCVRAYQERKRQWRREGRVPRPRQSRESKLLALDVEAGE